MGVDDIEGFAFEKPESVAKGGDSGMFFKGQRVDRDAACSEGFDHPGDWRADDFDFVPSGLKVL